MSKPSSMKETRKKKEIKNESINQVPMGKREIEQLNPPKHHHQPTRKLSPPLHKLLKRAPQSDHTTASPPICPSPSPPSASVTTTQAHAQRPADQHHALVLPVQRARAVVQDQHIRSSLAPRRLSGCCQPSISGQVHVRSAFALGGRSAHPRSCRARCRTLL
jgi:hypothetical protein